MNNVNKKFLSEEQGLDLKKWVFVVLKYWYIFLVSFPLFLGGGYVYLRYAVPVFEVESTILIRDKNSTGGVRIEEFLEGMDIGGKRSNIENEIGILTSYSMIKKAIELLDFEISYFSEGEVKTTELYNSTPFKVLLDSSKVTIKSVPIYLKFKKGKGFEVSIKGKEIGLEQDYIQNCEYNELCYSEYYAFRINQDSITEINYNEPYFFKVEKIESLAKRYRGQVKIGLASKKSSILRLSIRGIVPDKQINFIDKLAEVYILNELEEKNQIADNTIKFIDQQLILIAESLNKSEGQLESFRKNERVLNLSASASRAFSSLTELEKEEAILELNNKYYRSLLKYLIDDKDNVKDIIAPSTIGINDPALIRLIDELKKLNSNKISLEYIATDKNYDLILIDVQIDNVKKALLENVNNILKSSNIAIKDIRNRINETNSIIQKLPANERNLVNIQRTFNLNESLYTFLLQKRAEAGITKSSNIANNKIIDSAKLKSRVFPIKKKVLLISFLLSLVLPITIVVLFHLLNDKIKSIDQIERITDTPILGTIPLSKTVNSILNSPKSAIAESLRAIRVNLKFLLTSSKDKVIGITSTIGGEGKTFCAYNLSVILALSGKKVVLLGCDLRKPKLARHIDELLDDKAIGISSYLISDNVLGSDTYSIEKAREDGIIKLTSIDNLNFMPSGPLPPNPSEILGSERFKEMISALKKHFDYIIIDTPPSGIVADYFVLNSLLDASIYVVKNSYTREGFLSQLNTPGKFSNIAIIFNGVGKSNNEYGYNYGYGYGYGYGYYEDDKEKKKVGGFINKLFNV